MSTLVHLRNLVSGSCHPPEDTYLEQIKPFENVRFTLKKGEENTGTGSRSHLFCGPNDSPLRRLTEEVRDFSRALRAHDPRSGPEKDRTKKVERHPFRYDYRTFPLPVETHGRVEDRVNPFQKYSKFWFPVGHVVLLSVPWYRTT